MAEMDGKVLGKAYDVPTQIYPHSQGTVAVERWFVCSGSL